MTQAFTNMDAIWLSELAGRFNTGEMMSASNEQVNEIMARLRAVAQHIQTLDDRSGSYADGYAAAQRAMAARSNILPNPEGEDDVGASIIKQINSLEAQGKVRRVAQGERALEDKPHLFNGPVRRKPKAASSLDIELDLSGL